MHKNSSLLQRFRFIIRVKVTAVFPAPSLSQNCWFTSAVYDIESTFKVSSNVESFNWCVSGQITMFMRSLVKLFF